MSKSGSVFGKFIVWLFVVILIVAVVGVVLFFSLREQGLINYVEYNGERYMVGSDGGCFSLRSGETHEFSVKSLGGGDVTLSVKITSNADNNIRFAYNDEFHYSYTGDIKMDDYSDVFSLQMDTDSFTISIPQDMTVETALETKYGGDITLIDELSDNKAYFVITVMVNDSLVDLGFVFGIKVSGVTLNSPSIIF